MWHHLGLILFHTLPFFRGRNEVMGFFWCASYGKNLNFILVFIFHWINFKKSASCGKTTELKLPPQSEYTLQLSNVYAHLKTCHIVCQYFLSALI